MMTSSPEKLKNDQKVGILGGVLGGFTILEKTPRTPGNKPYVFPSW